MNVPTALQAKEQILSLIESRLESSEFLKAAQGQFRGQQIDEDLFKNTILVFVCALIPKALASILTSFVDTSSLWSLNLDFESKTEMANIFSEIIRLWPPFFGGLKVTKKQMELGPFHVPPNYGIFYANFLAHRDPEVFEDPDDFKPSRWNNLSRDCLFGFGAGVHRCIGENLMLDVMHFVGQRLVKTFTWEPPVENPMERDIKCLPVLRPRNLNHIIMKRRL